MGSSNPHDSFFRAVFSRPALAAEQLEAVLPRELLERLDLSTLREAPPAFVAATLANHESDVLLEVELAGESAFVYVLHEHQSTVDPLKPRLPTWLRQKSRRR